MVGGEGYIGDIVYKIMVWVGSSASQGEVGSREKSV